MIRARGLQIPISAINSIVLIPARMGSTRFPGKPLALINGDPMIVHVWRRATEAGIGPVVVACEDLEVADAVRDAGGRAELSGSHHSSGSDRIFEVLTRIDPDAAFNVVVNLQGDMPGIDPTALAAVLEPLTDPDVTDADIAIATLVSPIADDADRSDPHVVKALVDFADGAVGLAMDFARDPDLLGAGPHYHHIGVYAYRRSALTQFVGLPQSAREKEFGLEQLRALESGMTIGVRLVDTFPLGVDTPADLARAQAILAGSPRTN
jgi:3-deoxy-manno-octulosonate cytidylyltransferase (CMP-KDO synthetase)